MTEEIKCKLFNLGDPEDRKKYEKLLEQDDAEEIAIREKDKTWGNKAEGTLYVYVVYKILGDY